MAYQFIPLTPIPAHHVVHVIHAVGPTGSNGTQQYPKLTDWQLVSIMKPMIEDKILNVYGTKQSNEENAQNMLANLKKIAECAMCILCKIERDHGYCSCECLRALMHNQTAKGEFNNVVSRALLICFSFADLKICLDKTHKRNAVTEVNPHHSTFHQNAPKPANAAEEKTIEIIEQLEKLKTQSDKLRKELENMLSNH